MVVWIMDKRRKSTRRPLKIFVDHIVGAKTHCLCVSEDVSAGGISLLGEVGPGWGKPNHVWLQFELPNENGRLIRALGELRYEREQPNGQRVRGYRFKYMAPRERNAFNRFIHSMDTSVAA